MGFGTAPAEIERGPPVPRPDQLRAVARARRRRPRPSARRPRGGWGRRGRTLRRHRSRPGTIAAGTVAAQRVTVDGMRGGRPLLRSAPSWYCTTDLDPAWDLRPTGWRVNVEGDAPLDIDLPFPVPLDRMAETAPGLHREPGGERGGGGLRRSAGNPDHGRSAAGDREVGMTSSVVVVGNPTPGSRTRRAGEMVVERLTGAGPAAVIELADLGPALLGFGDPAVAAAKEQVLAADLVVFASAHLQGHLHRSAQAVPRAVRRR